MPSKTLLFKLLNDRSEWINKQLTKVASEVRVVFPWAHCSDQKVMQTRAVNFHLKSWELKGQVALERIQISANFSRAKHWQKFLQFSIFRGGRIKLISFDQNVIDWDIRQSRTPLPLLKDKEKIIAKITGQSMDRHRMIIFAAFFLCKTTLRFLSCWYIISRLLCG